MTAFGEERRQQLTELVDFPRENLSIEIKTWLDMRDTSVKAHVAREMLALANHGGGFLIFGFDDVGGSYGVSDPQPHELHDYSQDNLNGIVARYAEPPFEVEVHFVARSDGGSTHPIVIVPSDLDTPVRSSRDGPERRHVTQNTYYIRRPGPASAPIETGREWDVLLDRCIRTKREVLVDRIREMIDGTRGVVTETPAPPEPLDEFLELADDRFAAIVRENDDADRYEHGTWSVAYRVIGPVQAMGLSELRSTLEAVVGHETGWPVWWLPNLEENAPRVWENRIECWMAAGGVFLDGAHSDYWLADRSGMLFLRRGYQDDSGERGAPQVPGRFMDLTIPAWRVGECLLHAERFAAAVSEDLPSTEIELAAIWTGLAGRELTPWASPMRRMSPRRNHQQDTVRSRLTFSALRISERLPELTAAATKPFYEAFDFFEPPIGMFAEELDAMRHRRLR